MKLLTSALLLSVCQGFLAPVPSTFLSRKTTSPLSATATPPATARMTPVFDEVCETTGVTLTRFMIEVAMLNPELSELPSLFSGIETACKAISNMVKRSQLTGLTGYAEGGGSINVQGEEQKTLDIMTNDVLKRALRFTGKLGVLASEEEDTPVDVEPSSKEVMFDETSKYVAVFDPLDGSSNVDAGIPTGTIFGIFDHDEECVVEGEPEGLSEAEMVCLTNTLKPGTDLIASGYCLYSSSCFFVMTVGCGVYGFTLDESIGEFVLTHPNIKIPETSKIYSFNEANLPQWDAPMRETVEKWRVGEGKSGNRFSSRYIGSMVGDVHRTLLYGGVFGYPSDTKNKNGKLRLLYEGAPMSYLMEQAGGLSSTGTKRVMEITPDEVHQRVPIVMGSKGDVQEVLDAYKAAGM